MISILAFFIYSVQKIRMVEFRDAILETEEMKKVYVRRIPKDSTDEELKHFFETEGGPVTNVTVRRHGEHHVGFVTFAESATIDNMMLKKPYLIFQGASLDVTWAKPKHLAWNGVERNSKKLICTQQANSPTLGVTKPQLMTYFEARHDKLYGCIEGIDNYSDNASVLGYPFSLALRRRIRFVSYSLSTQFFEDFAEQTRKFKW